MRRGFLFSLDALLASLMLIGGVILIASIAQHDTDTTQVAAASQDIATVLASVRVREITEPWVAAAVANGSADGNATVLEQIGYYWATGRTDEARDLAAILANASGYNVRVTFDGTTVYEQGSPRDNLTTTVDSRMVSGIAEGKAITGSSASAHLKYIRDKRNSAFLTFGGFVGEGNVTVTTDQVPAGANVTDLRIELDASVPLALRINGAACDTLVPDPTPLEPTAWNLTNCTGLVVPGTNNTFAFLSTALNGSSISGGLIEIRYATDEIAESAGDGTTVYRFPRIDGLINLYDGFFIDGNVTAINVTIAFFSNYTSYLTIGNASFTFTGSNATQNVTLNDSDVAAALAATGLVYDDLSSRTIPLRFGIGDVQIAGNPADVVVVTDTSGSMAWCITNDLNPPCPANDTTKITAARNVTRDFVTSLLNTTITGTRVGLAEFGSSVKSWHNLTTNMTPLLAQISAYSATGGTCICCGINNATNSLNLEGQLLLIPRQSPGWKYNDTDLSSPPAGWNTSGYNDAGWKDGTTAIGWSYASLNTIIASKYQGDYYHRRKFNVTDADQIVDARLYVYSDDGADVYLNGARIDNNYGSVHSAWYWNRNGIWVNRSRFVTGENTVAARQWHRQGSSNRMGFDLQLIANTQGNTTGTQTKSIVLMSDGEATTTCSQQGTGNPTQDAIKAACDAYSLYGIVVYTVGFGLGADVSALTQMANCTTGEYFSASDSASLEAAFENIAGTIIENSGTQTAIIAGNVTQTILYDGRITAAYDPTVAPARPNEITLTAQSDPFGACNATVPIYPELRLLEAAVTSYSSDYWTSGLSVNGQEVYNLSAYSTIYASLGDPYRVRIPTGLLATGNNTILLSLGTDALNTTGNCSPNNTLIYTAAINLSTERSIVVERAEGCVWGIAFTDGTTENVTIPAAYAGTNECSYRPGNITYDAEDAYQLGAFTLFDRLDFRDEGMLFVNLREEDLEIIVTTIGGIPYLWGPALAKVEVTR